MPGERSAAESESTLGIASQHPVSWSIFALARSHKALAARMLAELGLYPGQEITLLQLHDRGVLCQRDIGALQRLDHSTVAKSVRRLETAGLVTRQQSSADRRSTEVRLTERGRELALATKDVWDRLERLTASALSAAEEAQFATLTAKLVAAVESGSHDGSARPSPGARTLSADS